MAIQKSNDVLSFFVLASIIWSCDVVEDFSNGFCFQKHNCQSGRLKFKDIILVRQGIYFQIDINS